MERSRAAATVSSLSTLLLFSRWLPSGGDEDENEDEDEDEDEDDDDDDDGDDGSAPQRHRVPTVAVAAGSNAAAAAGNISFHRRANSSLVGDAMNPTDASPAAVSQEPRRPCMVACNRCLSYNKGFFSSFFKEN